MDAGGISYSSVNASLGSPGGEFVTVIIPAYNARGFVGAALDSVLAQDHSELEILLIDDGSSDGTADFVSANYPMVRIVSQQNAGVAAARNTGLREATGDFITFLDADDGWFPGKLAAQLGYFREHREVGLVFHQWKVWKPDSDGVYRWPEAGPLTDSDSEVPVCASGWLYLSLLLDCLVHTSAVMVRSEVAREAGYFDTKLVNGEDYDYWLRISRLCKMHQLSGIYSFYRSVEGSLTSSPKAINYEYEVVLSALQRWGLVSPDGRSLHRAEIERRLARLAFDFGYVQYHRGDRKLARAAFSKVLRHSPTHWRAAIYLLLCQFSMRQKQPG